MADAGETASGKGGRSPWGRCKNAGEAFCRIAGEELHRTAGRLLGALVIWGLVGAALMTVGDAGEGRLRWERVNATAEQGAVDAAGMAGAADAPGTQSLQDGSEIWSGGGGDTAVRQTESNDRADREDGACRQVALTFDDGPHPVYTAKLLDGLSERGICATFFVVGKNIPGNEEVIARMAAEGHLIGNHTYDHVKIAGMDNDDACAQVEKTSALVREITGKDTEFVRPPFGSWDKTLECPFQMIPVLWDVDPLDWTTKNTELVVQRVLDDVEAGDIILLHDFYESSVDAALEIADRLMTQGYEFVTVDELILE